MADSPEKKTAEEEHRSLLRGAGVFGLSTAASRALGIVRTLALSSLLGPMYRDAFLLAFKIPNMFRNLFGEGALANSFTPVYVERLNAGDREGANRLASLVATALTAGLTALAALGIMTSFAVRHAVRLSASNDLVMRLLEIMALFLPLVCLFAFFIAVLTSHRRFAAPGAGPIMLNLAMLAGLYLVWKQGIEPGRAVFVLAAAVLAGGVGQLALQLPSAWRAGVRLSPAFDVKDSGFRQIAARMGPVLVGTAAFQVCMLINSLLAMGFCEQGSLSYLSISNFMVAAPIGVVAVAMGTAALPVLSSLHARGDRKGFNKSFLGAARMGAFLLMPVIAVFMIAGEPMIRLLFERHNWGPEETLPMTRVLFWASVALVPSVLAMLAGRAFYAMGKPRIPARIALVTVSVNLALSLLLVGSYSVTYLA